MGLIGHKIRKLRKSRIRSLAGRKISADFEYVVERRAPDPCFFGSRVPRSTSPIGKGLSAAQKRQAPETFPEIGPGHYGAEKYNTALDKLFNKIRSNKGVGPLASDEPRFREKIFQRTPSPTRYTTARSWEPKKQNEAPFLSLSRRLTHKVNKFPGPGTYALAAKKCRRTRFMHNFGRPSMIPTIEIICVSRPSDTCTNCNQMCCGDYWQKDYTLYLCHLCWEEEKRGREMYTEKQLKMFKKIRNCSFAHSHEGTTAAIRLLPPNKINKKLRLENYLDLYIEC